MPYARSGPKNEIIELRDEITHEVNTDAEHLANAVFGGRGGQPDMQRMSDEQLDARYRQAYTTQDRRWLISEAQRDPEQFVTVARRIGVMLPDEMDQMFAQAAPVAPPIAPPPVQPEPVPPPLPAPVAPAPGLPLPGAVAAPGQPVPLTVPAPGA